MQKVKLFVILDRGVNVGILNRFAPCTLHALVNSLGKVLGEHLQRLGAHLWFDFGTTKQSGKEAVRCF